VRIPSLSPIALATALELGAKNVFPTVDLVNQAGNGGAVTIDATNTLWRFRYAVRLVDWSRVVLAGIPDGDAWWHFPLRWHAGAASRSSSCAVGAMIIRATDLVTSGRVSVRAIVTHRESLNAAA
jgi:threonine dehydrogenase-like Zn-dependent dehydrogenase